MDAFHLGDGEDELITHDSGEYGKFTTGDKARQARGHAADRDDDLPGPAESIDTGTFMVCGSVITIHRTVQLH